MQKNLLLAIEFILKTWSVEIGKLLLKNCFLKNSSQKLAVHFHCLKFLPTRWGNVWHFFLGIWVALKKFIYYVMELLMIVVTNLVLSQKIWNQLNYVLLLKNTVCFSIRSIFKITSCIFCSFSHKISSQT